MANPQIKRKVNLLGEAGVGKTSLTLRFVKNVFGDKYLKTIGTNVYTKQIPVANVDVKLIIFDIMGDTGFDSVRDRAFENSSGGIAVADFTRKETLDKLIDDWLPKYRELAVADAPIILAINKVDLDKQELSRKEIIDNTSHYVDAIYFTSAKTGENVEEIYKELGFRTILIQELGIRTVYHHPSPEKGVKNIDTINDPKKLLSILLTFASELGNMTYSTREKIFEERGINKFSLDEGISEQQVLSFGDGLIQWYEENNDQKSVLTIKRILKKYSTND